MRKSEAKKAKTDLERYFKFMMSGNLEGCIAIEKKYGLYGGTPEMVTEHLKVLSQSDAYLDNSGEM